MPRVVKRQSEDESAEDFDVKKAKMHDNLLKFEQMKTEAEENRRRVRDQYLKEYEASLLVNNNASTTDPAQSNSVGSEPAVHAVPVVRAPKSPSARRKSTSSTEGSLLSCLFASLHTQNYYNSTHAVCCYCFFSQENPELRRQRLPPPCTLQ